MDKYRVVHTSEGLLSSTKKKCTIKPCKEVANKTNIFYLVKEGSLKRRQIILTT